MLQGKVLSIAMMMLVSGSLFAVTIQDGFPKVASTSEGTKGVMVAMLDVSYDKLLTVVKDLEKMKYYVHPQAMESRVVEEGENPVVFFKVKIVASMTREAYLQYTITESEDKIIQEWKDIVWDGKSGTFKVNKGRAIFSRQVGDKTQVQYVVLVDADLPLLDFIKRSLMTKNLNYYVNQLEKVVLETEEDTDVDVDNP